MPAEGKRLADVLNNRVLIYIAEFLCASATAYLLVVLFPQHRFIWAMTSIAFVMAPKSDDSKALIYDRIKANILGSIVGFALMTIPFLPAVALLCGGIVLTILLSRALKIYKTVRSALVALVIIMIPSYHDPGTIIALERMLCVIMGCLIALSVTVLFDYAISKYGPQIFETGTSIKSSDEA